MITQKLKDSLTRKGFLVQHFATAEEATQYLTQRLTGETIGFGGSITVRDMGLFESLGEKNTTLWHWKNPADKDCFSQFTTYITSANAIAETGELVNIDGNGNRVASTLYGPKKLIYVVGANKVAPDLAAAIDRARNVAAPANAKRLNKKTPCAVTGKCADCKSPERICKAMVITMQPVNDFEFTEVVLIDAALGY